MPHATGYQLVKDLKASAEDCPNGERALLMFAAAEEIARLVEELKVAERRPKT